ncbi:MAG: hypothetical protein JWL95_2823 [Gemmatimonadetes bacterium]|nr:hypothetical protein [Gemmatimonadota bacterium]
MLLAHLAGDAAAVLPHLAPLARSTVHVLSAHGAHLVTAVCRCGAQAFPTLYVSEATARESVQTAAEALLANTEARCGTGAEAPGCARRRHAGLRLVTGD